MTNEALGSVQEQPEEEEIELPQEDLQQMMMVVPVEEVYVEALQVKYPIIDCEVYCKDTRRYWRIIRVGNHTEAYQIFVDMLKKFDRDDLIKLWYLVKKRFSTTEPIDDKEKELWVKLSGEGAALELEVPDESKGKSIDTHEGTGDDERTKSGDDKSIDLNKEEETQEDEFVHTLDDYVPTDDETDDVDDEEYDCINKEMYDDVNVELKDVEPVDEGNGDKEMTDAEKDDAHATVTTAPATQKTAVPLPSSSISSDYAAKFLNFDNIPSANTEIISMMEIKVQHEDPTTISTTTVPDSTTLTAIHQRVSDLEKKVNILKDINHDSAILAAIKSEVPSVVKKFLGIDLDDTLKRVIKKQLAKFIQEQSVPAAAVVDAINKQLDSQKSVADICKIKMEKEGKQQETKYTITSSDTAELQEFD
ncbi:hypothetical protein Tco_0117012 [Tanacetum coccineum]